MGVGSVALVGGEATPISGAGEIFTVTPIEAHATPQPIFIAVQLGIGLFRVACR